MSKNPLTSFQNAALSYLERFSVSEKQLLDFLKRRKKRLERKGDVFPEDIENGFQEIVRKMVSLGYVNNDRLKERTIELLRNEGRSARYIQMKLMQKGLVPGFESSDEDDESAARHFYEKKKLKDIPKEKALAKLARAGFSLTVARKVISS